jgi:PAS domain S-box-containing protein
MPLDSQRVLSHASNLFAATLAYIRARRPQSFSLRQHLFFLVLISALPLMALALFVSLDRLNAERDTARMNLMATARVLASYVDNELDTYLAIAHTLSKSPTLLRGDMERFWQEAKDAIAFVPESWILVSDPDGKQLLNTLRPFGTVLPPRNERQWRERALATGRPQLTDLYTGNLVRRFVASIEVPIVQNGVAVYSFALVVDPGRFHKILEAQHYPPSWLLGILDRQGRFVSRIPEHDQRVGTLASEGWRAGIAKAAEGWTENRTLEGEPALTAYTSTRDGWIVGISLPESLLHAPARRSAIILFGAGSFLFVVGLLLAWWASSRIARPATQLALAAAEMRQGRVLSMQRTGVREFDGVADQFEGAAQAIREREAELLQLNERFKIAEEASNGFVYEIDVANGQLWRGDSFTRVLGYAPDEVAPTFDAWQRLLHPDDASLISLPSPDVKADHSPYSREYRVRHKDGRYIWLWDRGQIVQSTAGKTPRLVGTCLDVTARKEMEEANHLLTRELAHRVRNSLSVIQSLARYTLKTAPDPETFTETFTGRIYALARAHELLTETGQGVNLRHLISDQLLAVGLDDKRITIEGPDLRLAPELATNLALIFHELAINAAKHGAFSTKDGTLTIAWDVTEDLNVSWKERGGPPAHEPSHTGFGTVLINSSGPANWEYLTTGLRCHFQVTSFKSRR